MIDLEALAKDIEGHAEAEGWNLHPTLLILTSAKAVIVALNNVTDIDRIPPQPQAEALFLVSEGWTYPKHVLDQFDTIESLMDLHRRQPPSQHPQRVEVRTVVAASRDTALLVSRNRGEEACVGTQVKGHNLDRLRRLFG